MPVLVAYVDESHDDEKFCLSAIVIEHAQWHNALEAVRKHRLHLKDTFGIKLSHELHSYKLVRGKGRSFATRDLTKWERSRIFHSQLDMVARLPTVRLFNVVLDKSKHRDPQMTAWDRLTNRLERTMLHFEEVEMPIRKSLFAKAEKALPNQDSERLELRLLAYAPRTIIIADQGREGEINGALRRMRRYNPIPSKYGTWDDGGATKNIRVERIIEDPVFRESHRSYFVQLADAVAYSLLKREVPPTPVIERYGIHKMFDECLKSVCYTKASSSDPMGIVRK
jgi:hypothetical protein